MAHILIVDDEGKIRALLAMALFSGNYQISEACSGEEALTILKASPVDLVLSDIRMDGMTGIELLTHIKQLYPAIPVIVMTAFADAKTGIEAMKRGALRYIAKPFEMEEMLMLIERALADTTKSLELERLQKDVDSYQTLKGIIGESRAIHEVIAAIKSVASRETTVLVRGRSGTGKELVARGVHAESGRKGFIAINCGALPENLLESELFGHEKGSFTGAIDKRLGLFEQAGSGTVFLDEIGDISQSLQVKLLRVLQEKEFTRVGATQCIKTTARVIAATNKDLEAAVKDGTFREDLYYRLNIFPILIPSLAQRREDIPLLADSFLLKFHHTGGIAKKTLDILLAYTWPGNIRELENCIERSVIVSNNEQILPQHLPTHITIAKTNAFAGSFLLPDDGVSLDEVEKSLIMQALEKASGNKTKAASLLGISRRALYSRMNTHGILVEGSDEDAFP